MKFKCTNCGVCCKGNNVILLTDSDIKRFKEGWWDDSEFCKLYVGLAVVEGIPEATGVIPAGFEEYPIVELENGIKGFVMIIRKDAEDGSGEKTCYFLDGAISQKLTFCRAHPIRPMMCRLYPATWTFNIGEKKAEDVLVEVPDGRIEECAGLKEETEVWDYFDAEKIAYQLVKELEQYHVLVRGWNKREKKGNLYQFIQFLLGEEDENSETNDENES